MSPSHTPMNLESLAAELRGFVGVTRKKQIGELISFFPIESKQIIASFGEDAAVIATAMRSCSSRGRHLVQAHGRRSRVVGLLLRAGECARHRRYGRLACRPVVDVLSAGDPEISRRVLEGMKKGIEKLRVPINRRPPPSRYPLQRPGRCHPWKGEEERCDPEQHSPARRGGHSRL